MDTYDKVVTSDAFRDMERYSDNFLRRNRAILDSYPRQWVPDPLHQWSRQWEYPFVYSHLFSRDKDFQQPLKILDAGSGMTFFPYYIKKSLPVADIYCCDIDETLEFIFNQVDTPNNNTGVKFSIQDITATSYEDNKFDVIYCISVVEHMDTPGNAIKEFHRVLKPGGILLLTLDISIDGGFDLPISAASKFLVEASELFGINAGPLSSLDSIYFNDKRLLTTHEAEKRNQALLPWQPQPIWKRLLKSTFNIGNRGKTPYLTVFCIILRKL